jgi:hypothetical protein
VPSDPDQHLNADDPVFARLWLAELGRVVPRHGRPRWARDVPAPEPTRDERPE